MFSNKFQTGIQKVCSLRNHCYVYSNMQQFLFNFLAKVTINTSLCNIRPRNIDRNKVTLVQIHLNNWAVGWQSRNIHSMSSWKFSFLIHTVVMKPVENKMISLTNQPTGTRFMFQVWRRLLPSPHWCSSRLRRDWMALKKGALCSIVVSIFPKNTWSFSSLLIHKFFRSMVTRWICDKYT